MAATTTEGPAVIYYPADLPRLLKEKGVKTYIEMVHDHEEFRGVMDPDLEDDLLIRKKYSKEALKVLVEISEKPSPRAFFAHLKRVLFLLHAY